MTSFRVHLDEVPLGAQHCSVRVFVGPDPDHRASAGRLIMRLDEAEAFATFVNGRDDHLQRNARVKVFEAEWDASMSTDKQLAAAQELHDQDCGCGRTLCLPGTVGYQAGEWIALARGTWARQRADA